MHTIGMGSSEQQCLPIIEHLNGSSSMSQRPFDVELCVGLIRRLGKHIGTRVFSKYQEEVQDYEKVLLRWKVSSLSG